MLKNVSKETAHCVDFKSTLTRTTHIWWENICFRANFPFYCSNEFLLRGYHSLGNQSGIETCSPRSTRKLPGFPLQSLSWKTKHAVWLMAQPTPWETWKSCCIIASSSRIWRKWLGYGPLDWRHPPHISTGCITPMGWIDKPAVKSHCCCSMQHNWWKNLGVSWCVSNLPMFTLVLPVLPVFFPMFTLVYKKPIVVASWVAMKQRLGHNPIILAGSLAFAYWVLTHPI